MQELVDENVARSYIHFSNQIAYAGIKWGAMCCLISDMSVHAAAALVSMRLRCACLWTLTLEHACNLLMQLSF